MARECKYYNKHLDTIRAYIGCLYSIAGCSCGGLLHIVTDDKNVRDSDIEFCLQQCNEHPECEESELGKLICKELLKLTMPQRRLVMEYDGVIKNYCRFFGCDKCWVEEDED